MATSEIPQALKVATTPVRKKKLAPEEVPGYICKTRLCRFFVENRCKRGKACTFAHGEANVQLKPDLLRTRLCKSVKEERLCRNPRCTFAHSIEELRDMRLLPNLVAPSPDVRVVPMERKYPAASKVPMPARLMASKSSVVGSDTCSTTTSSDDPDMDLFSEASTGNEVLPRIRQTVVPLVGFGETMYIGLPDDFKLCVPGAEGLTSTMSF